MKQMLVLLTLGMIASSAMASVVGLSNYPLTMQNKAMSTEFNNYMSNGKGMGINARYHQRLNELMNFDLGAGVAEGDRANRFFTGLDTQIIPDYGRQPRVSVKGMIETMEFDGERITNIGFAPIVSKGFSISGYEAFPYLATPINMMLIGDSQRDESIAAAVGINGRVPFEGFENVIANAEINMSIRNSYSGFVIGMSLPID